MAAVETPTPVTPAAMGYSLITLDSSLDDVAYSHPHSASTMKEKANYEADTELFFFTNYNILTAYFDRFQRHPSFYRVLGVIRILYWTGKRRCDNHAELSRAAFVDE